ncbi:aminodeoxychorismate synthase component I [Listeria costaricensis]|uniref:aminodeoxychorismate synthase component I n=1 Tax=Listeria costaricensis TaxID=2026604 RepID=UPI000C06CDFE|nr:aminodeoxychorismate synthase component I [Listeria costaricensis]
MSRLRFDFEGQTKIFTNPEVVLMTDDVAEIPEIMAQMEGYRAQGYYIAGYMSYDAAPAFHSEMVVHSGNRALPLIWFGIYRDFSTGEQVGADLAWPLDLVLDTAESDYRRKIEQIRQHIKNGVTYQTNYTVRATGALDVEANLDDTAFARLYGQLRHVGQVDYAAHLDLGRWQILSASPELFFKVRDGQIVTRPMKGTARRGANQEADRQLRAFLANDEKNHSENVMIVDLLRNDLGRIAKTGSVKVPKLCSIEGYPTVWQMTSTVTAELLPETDLLEIFRALFPCGSITGAPKVSTMQVIAELETAPREVYCGAIGYISPDSEMIFSVPIRTLVYEAANQRASYGVGGGIVWDSDPAAEFQEVHAKMAVLKQAFPTFGLIESMRLENGQILRFEKHLARLEKSARELAFTFDDRKIKNSWQRVAAAHSVGIYKLRSVLYANGNLEVTADPIPAQVPEWDFQLADRPIDFQPLLAHKVTERDAYEMCRKAGSVETLLWNDKHELTEFINGNLVIEKNNQKMTPPLSAGILGGIFRDSLLQAGEVHEQTLSVADLHTADRVWCTNSVRGWIQMKWQK